MCARIRGDSATQFSNDWIRSFPFNLFTPYLETLLTISFVFVDSFFRDPSPCFPSQNWEVDEEAMEARLAECQANANAAAAKWKYECQRAHLLKMNIAMWLIMILFMRSNFNLIH